MFRSSVHFQSASGRALCSPVYVWCWNGFVELCVWCLAEHCHPLLALCYKIRLILYDLHPIFDGPLSTLLHPVLASSYPLWQDFSKRASVPIVCVDWLYEKAVWGVVKSWEFEGNLRCSKMLRKWRKNSLKRVLSFSREYCVYFDITCKRSSEFEFREVFEKLRDFFREQI